MWRSPWHSFYAIDIYCTSVDHQWTIGKQRKNKTECLPWFKHTVSTAQKTCFLHHICTFTLKLTTQASFVMTNLRKHKPPDIFRFNLIYYSFCCDSSSVMLVSLSSQVCNFLHFLCVFLFLCRIHCFPCLLSL